MCSYWGPLQLGPESIETTKNWSMCLIRLAAARNVKPRQIRDGVTRHGPLAMAFAVLQAGNHPEAAQGRRGLHLPEGRPQLPDCASNEWRALQRQPEPQSGLLVESAPKCVMSVEKNCPRHRRSP